MHYLFPPEGKPASIAPSLEEFTDRPLKKVQPCPYPYPTEPEPGNPTVIPVSLLSKFHFVFLIRDPHHSVPSYFRCTIPPLDDITGFHDYDPREAGYDELRRGFDFLRKAHLVGPRVSSRDDDDVANGAINSKEDGEYDSGIEICTVDADDLLDSPVEVIRTFCQSVGVPYTPEMLRWDNAQDQAHAKHNFEKWRGFHNDAIESTGLVGRKEVCIFEPSASILVCMMAN